MFGCLLPIKLCIMFLLLRGLRLSYPSSLKINDNKINKLGGGGKMCNSIRTNLNIKKKEVFFLKKINKNQVVRKKKRL